MMQQAMAMAGQQGAGGGMGAGMGAPPAMPGCVVIVVVVVLKRRECANVVSHEIKTQNRFGAPVAPQAGQQQQQGGQQQNDVGLTEEEMIQEAINRSLQEM